MLDIVANMGYYSLLAAARRNVAQVVCFEPNPMVTPILRYNVQANSALAGKVTIVEAAAGDADGIVPFIGTVQNTISVSARFGPGPMMR